MDSIPVFKPYLGKEESDLLLETIRDSWITGGKKVKEFELKIAELTNVKHAVACSNGTMALYIGLIAIGIKQGDEVIVPDFTFIASANAVILAGGIPKFCDIKSDTFNIDIKLAKKKLSSSTKAIMPVHIYGQSSDMNEVMKFAKDEGLRVIGDSAQAIGVTFNQNPVASIGEINAISFYADKTLTTGEGGMILTNNDILADKALMLKHQGRRQRGIYFHETIGYNFRMTDMQAAVGLAQLKKLNFMIQRKKEIEKQYYTNLIDIKEITIPYRNKRNVNVPFRINILVKNPAKLMNHLKLHKIDSMRFFYPIHKQPCYSYFKLKDEDFPNSIWAYEHGISLPSFVELKHEQIDYICDKIKEFYKYQ